MGKLVSIIKYLQQVLRGAVLLGTIGIVGYLHEYSANANSVLLPQAQSNLPTNVLVSIDLDAHPMDVFMQENDPSVLQFLANYIVQTQTTDWPKGYRSEFLRDIAEAALISAKNNQIPPSVIMGQAVLESGWGTSRLAQEYNNLFGIKGVGGNTVKVKTFERNSKNKRYKQMAHFRIFESRQEAIMYHGNLLAKDRRYKKARKYRHDWQSFMEEAAPYYATAPDYNVKLFSIITDYKLDRWDDLVTPQG